MDYTYTGYGNGAAYPNYYHGGLNVGFPTYHSMAYLYAPGMVRDRCLPDKQPESKPRLSKDEVELLESHFRQNPKPPSSVKRELAERMKVEIPRINNWFQNRRAKAKQERKQEEYKACQEAAVKAAPQSPAQGQTSSVQEHFPLSNEQAPLQPCVASFGSNDSHDQASSQAQVEPEPTRQAPESMTRSMSRQESSPFSPDNAMESVEDPAISQSNEDYLSQTSCDSFGAVIDCTSPSDDASHMLMYDGLQIRSDPIDDVFHPSLGLEPNPIDMTTPAGLGSSEGPREDMTSKVASGETSTPSIVSPPAPTKFKSPPPAADIARRRNRRPLGLSPFPCHGQPSLKTCVGDMPRRSETTSPIRRIASATGCAPPRVMKSTAGPAPRSPMLSEQKREALLQSLQGPGSPVLGLSINAAVTTGPPTPRTPLYIGQQENREQTASSVTSEEDGRPYAYQQDQVASFVKIDDPSMKTPPGTPGVIGFPETMYVPNTIEAAYNYVARQEEPLFTPGVQGGFPPELDFNASLGAPEYVSSSIPSQPVTPSFPPTGVGAACFNGGVGGNEYTWPDSVMNCYSSSGRSSPGSRSKTFQFTPNMTPQHFNIER